MRDPAVDQTGDLFLWWLPYGNVPVVYMTAVDGWAHDRFGTTWLLAVDALSAVACGVIAFFVLRKISGRRATIQP